MVDAKPSFGSPIKEQPRSNEEEKVFQTLKPGRLLRFGVLNKQNDADTQYDLPSPINTVVSTFAKDDGVVRNDKQLGTVMWRYAGIRSSEDQRLIGRGAHIGWKKDEKGQFTVQLMHPDHKDPEPNPTLGL